MAKMLVCAPHQQQLLFPSFQDSVCVRRRRNCSTTKTTPLYFFVPKSSPHRKLFLVHSSPLLNQTAWVSDDDNNRGSNQQILREHNARTKALLLRHLSDEQSTTRDDVEKAQARPEPTQEEEDEMMEEEKVKLLEMSLGKRRSPQFAGSIYLQSRVGPEGRNSPPPLQRLFRGGATDIDDDKMLLRALEIRRKVTAEIFKEAMRAGRLRITFSTNLVSRLPDFIDYIMIQAASLKGLPEFSNSTFHIRAKTVIQNSSVIPLIRCLKHNSLTYSQIGKLVCMSCENLELIRQKIEWLKTIHVKSEFLGATFAKAGGNILQRSTQELDEIVCYLESNGVRREWMGSVVSRCPPLLGYTMDEVKSRVNFYLDMGMDEKDFGTMVFDFPKALGFFTLEDMNSKVQYLREFGFSNEDIGRLLAFKPHLMGCSIEERWKPLVKYLYYLGVRRDGMRRILTLKPLVFCVDLETTIAPKVRFFLDIGVRKEAIGSMLVKFPPLLTYSLYKKIRPVVIFLIAKAGVTKGEIGKVIALGPELLGCSVVNKLEINVKPKYSYLRRTMVRPLQDLIEFPRFFSYSLDGRIIPRHKVLVENRINFKLRYMLASSDEEFNERVVAAVERRRKFECGLINESTPDFHATNSSVEKQVIKEGMPNAGG
ncbi:transcription termination factor MTERF2, chloroplastic-like isoform X2 [Macadamia integrifolia]|uniref:transcription termination factor MTERF2, chloroplastic-like isoform X2 n=1 Tax=Macadamia integrifolia TaxID=60698 RepID=UPI001C4E3168|nr:transcription termination factor MTERF2, chloroplastic-like isoform X2 [Macadamia integrifolia]